MGIEREIKGNKNKNKKGKDIVGLTKEEKKN